MVTKPVRILLELEADGESLSGHALRLEVSDTGSAWVAEGARREFTGWLGMLAVLEALVPHQPPTGDDVPPVP